MVKCKRGLLGMLDKLQTMSVNLIEAIREKEEPEELIKAVLFDLKVLLGCSVIFADNDGHVIEYLENSDEISININESGKCGAIEPLLNEQLKNSIEINNNLKLSHLYIRNVAKHVLDGYYCVIMPAAAANKRVGTMLLYRKDRAIEGYELTMAGYALAFSCVIIANIFKEESYKTASSEISVKSAVDTLSYSELEAVVSIFGELKGDEGLIVASKVADKYNITRSVIVNGLRKLESAGLIESRSLGMKGTFIKVRNTKLIEELYKLRN